MLRAHGAPFAILEKTMNTRFMSLKRAVAALLIVSTASFGFYAPAQAQIIGTEEAQTSASTQADRDKVNNFLQRDDVRQALVGRGVSSDAAQERVRAMTDAEVAQLAERIDQAPAGGDALGVIFAVFIVLLITDIIGWTKVFPFTRSIR
jgi:hypothetical protein